MDDPVVVMDDVVNQVAHLVVNAFHHPVCHHLVVVVNEMVCVKRIITRRKAGIRRVRIIWHRNVWKVW